MAGRRRWLQFSLRAFWAVLTIGCIWIGWLANRAHEQRRAARAVRQLGGIVYYDRQLDWTADNWTIKAPSPPRGPRWLRSLVGDEFFQHIEMVVVDERTAHPPPTKSDVLKLVERLKRLPRLRRFYAWFTLDEPTQREITAALPACDVRFPDSAQPPVEHAANQASP